ncbi:pyruvate, water dikinase regulatory protein [Paenibacillus chitinolyticus]|uniref:pyruvate, water dikinase regulatory protein n=1 Tax=Paenibacillus chitinolyticus TaxID=79263 RepID=UPI002DBC49D6|nr:pyruvate, water dikinase regulatory protein [Paenibacillus chitinolyticus]MEC0244221.1 kinase/pyrophosphorylase [Paenibacillus chitinolyticus]
MNPSNNPVIVYVVSDAIGETGESVVNAVALQFYPAPVVIERVPFVHDTEEIDRLLAKVARQQGIIAFTLVIPELRDYLTQRAEQAGFAYVDLLGPLIQTFEKAFNRKARHQPGGNHPLDEDYFKKMEAIEFAVKYDDGRDFSGIVKADIVLVGVSRTSKTPLSMYLAHKKYKVANVPLVPEMQPPDVLFKVPKNKVIGLLIDPDKLNAIRRERLRTLGLASNATYAKTERIKQELEFAGTVLSRIGCHVIDVSNRAVEETASLVLEQIRRHPHLS